MRLDRRGFHVVDPDDVGRLGLTAAIDSALIADGHDPECVTYICPTHHRHCTRITTEHTVHACWFCHHLGPEEEG